MNLFEQELANGFAELAAEAGTEDALTFKGAALVGVLDQGDGDPLRTDTTLGPPPKRLRLLIARAALDALPLWPKVGEAFDYGTGKLSIKEIEADDPTDPTVVVTVKRA
jgi:hypothetical protein